MLDKVMKAFYHLEERYPDAFEDVPAIVYVKPGCSEFDTQYAIVLRLLKYAKYSHMLEGRTKQEKRALLRLWQVPFEVSRKTEEKLEKVREEMENEFVFTFVL